MYRNGGSLFLPQVDKSGYLGLLQVVLRLVVAVKFLFIGSCTDAGIIRNGCGIICSGSLKLMVVH